MKNELTVDLGSDEDFVELLIDKQKTAKHLVRIEMNADKKDTYITCIR